MFVTELENKKPIRLVSIDGSLITPNEKKWTRFLKTYFGYYNVLYATNGEEYTPPGCVRSLGDIYLLVKYYYPHVSLGQVRRWLLKYSGINSWYCGEIGKRVFGAGGEDSDLNGRDEYGFPIFRLYRTKKGIILIKQKRLDYYSPLHPWKHEFFKAYKDQHHKKYGVGYYDI